MTLLLTAAYTVSFIDRQVLNLLVEPIKQDLVLSDMQISVLQGPAFVVSYILMSVPLGRLVDKINRIKVLISGIAFWSVSTAGCGFAGTSAQLIAARAGVGTGEAALTPASWSLLADSFPEKKRSLPVSIFLMGPYLGAGLSLILGGRLLLLFDHDVHLFGDSIVLAPWQSSFIAVSLPGLFLILLLSFLKEPKRKETVQEDTTEHSFLDALRFVRSRFRVYFSFWGGASFLVVMLYGLQAWVPSYLVRVHGWTLSEAGLSYGPIALVGGSLGVLSGPVLSGWLEKFGRRDAPLIVAAFAGAMLTLLGIVTFMLPSETAALIGISLLSFFVTLPLTLMATSLQRITPNEYRGFVAGVYVVSVNILGLGLGPTFVAFLTDMVFKSEIALNLSLASLFALFAPVSAVVFVVGRSPFVKLIDDRLK